MLLNTKIKTFLFVGISSALFTTTAGAAIPVTEELTLDQAIQKAITSNQNLAQTRLSLQSAELSYKDAWDRMFLPTISLEASSTAYQTIAQLPDTSAEQTGKIAESHGYPTSSFGLTFGSYTLFNFWRDRIRYDIASIAFERSKQQFTETERSLRFQVVSAYFRVKTNQEKMDAAQRSIDLSAAIYGLVKSKVATGTATERDVSSSHVDLLNAKNTYSETAKSVRSDQWDLNLLLGQPIDTSYRLTTEMKYTHLLLTPERALRIVREYSPSVKDAVVAMKTSEMNLELAQKERLPLPTITLSGVRITYNNSYYGNAVARDTSNSGTNGNIDISTSIGLSVPLLGPGGIFNNRNVAQARISRDSNELRYQLLGYQNQTRVYSLISTIKQQEEIIKNLKESFESSAGLLDGLIASISSGRVSRLELRDAVVQARESEFSYKDYLLSHLTNKLSLAEFLGLDMLPGDSYQ